MQVIGLTGGIASGKSTVSRIFKNAGAVIVDADRIARDVVKKGLPAYREIIDTFGDKVLAPGGEIDRSVLGDIIFNDPQKKQLLDRIVHPHVRKETSLQLKHIEKNDSNSIVILDIPMLMEAQMHKELSDVIVVYVPEDTQVKRLIQRDGISEADALVRIRSQMPIEEKKDLATIIIDNSGSRQNTHKQTLEIFKRFNKQTQ